MSAASVGACAHSTVLRRNIRPVTDKEPLCSRRWMIWWAEALGWLNLVLVI